MKILYLYTNSCKKKRLAISKKLANNKDLHFLYGKESISKRGYDVSDDFDVCERIENSLLGRLVDFVFNNICKIVKASGGCWYKVFALKTKIKEVDVVFSTVDRVGIPLVILTYFKLVPRKAIIYTSVGLVERFKSMNSLLCHFYQKIINEVAKKIICYGWDEFLILKKIFGEGKVQFIPFGVNIDYFYSGVRIKTGNYLLSIGADRNRDLDLLFNVAKLIDYEIILVTTKARILEIKKRWNNFPHNIFVLLDIPLWDVKKLLAHSKFVVLPVKDNSYSGATTTLLQAMAMGKAVIVSETGAIKKGYRLINGTNCILVAPGDQKGFLKAIRLLWSDRNKVQELGENAKILVKEHFFWGAYVDNLCSLFDSLFEKEKQNSWK